MPIPLIAAGTLASVAIVPLVVKVLVGLGVGFAVYTGLTAVFDASFGFIVESFQDLPLEVLGILGLANIDKYITMIFSAHAVRLVLMGVNSSGVLTKFSAKGLAQSA